MWLFSQLIFKGSSCFRWRAFQQPLSQGLPPGKDPEVAFEEQGNAVRPRRGFAAPAPGERYLIKDTAGAP